MIDKTAVLNIVKTKGPVIPRDIVKELGSDTMFTGAVLSQLVDNKEIKLSYAKIGGSPVYYAQGQEPKLEMLYEYLHEKEKKAYDLIKQKKILRDYKLEPVMRVALRNIKDFAKALEVNLKERKEIFWKWYLFPNSEAEKIIRELLAKEFGTIKKEVPKKVEKKPEPKILKEPIKTEKQEKLEPEKKEPPKKKTDESHELLSKINEIFETKNIEIINTEVIRKNSDIEMEIIIPSPAGDLNYFCKIKDKKKTNDKDLSAVFIQAQMKKLPVLYATTGDLTKKAKEMLEKEFKTISVLQI